MSKQALSQVQVYRLSQNPYTICDVKYGVAHADKHIKEITVDMYNSDRTIDIIHIHHKTNESTGMLRTIHLNSITSSSKIALPSSDLVELCFGALVLIAKNLEEHHIPFTRTFTDTNDGNITVNSDMTLTYKNCALSYDSSYLNKDAVNTTGDDSSIYFVD